MKNILFIVRALREHVDSEAVVSNSDAFKVLIATVLSQRTKDSNTEKASKQLFEKFDTPKKLAIAPLKEIEKLIKPSGFYKVKARRIKKISKQLVEKFNGKVPCLRQQLLQLEGVGPKTAGCVEVYGFGLDALPVDTHVFRISNRIGLVHTKTPEETEQALKKVVPKKCWKEVNHLMVKFGQNVCLPRNPKCEICAIQKQCDYFAEHFVRK